MRNRSKHSNGTRIMEIERLKEEPHLSGAYIRSLVKQLTSSKNKLSLDEPMTQNPDSKPSVGAATTLPQNLAAFSDGSGKTQQEKQQQQPSQTPVKKQVRRRLHTSRPYQERLLNMAEARREIVTALKFHRAAMKQAAAQEPPIPEPEKIKIRRNPRIYPSNNTFSDYFNGYSIASFTSPLQVPAQSSNFSWFPASNPPLSSNETINLPQQTLGLNLNFQDLGAIDSTLYCNNTKSYKNDENPLFSASSTVLCTQVSETMKIDTPVENAPPAQMSDSGSSHAQGNALSPESCAGILHPAMDDEEMAEIRSLGKQHEMEWNDTVNLVKSAWWFKFLESLEMGPDGYESGENKEGFQLFDKFMEIPAWLQDTVGEWESPLESCFLQPQCDDSEDFLQHSALPCMDLVEFEAVDAEWLA